MIAMWVFLVWAAGIRTQLGARPLPAGSKSIGAESERKTGKRSSELE
jgi:hypothetical protein